MIGNIIITMIRNMRRNLLFTMINVVGLSIGIAVSLLIFMWVQDEWSYDKFNVNGDRVFRVERKGTWQGQDFQVPGTSPMFGPQLKADYPEVVEQARLYGMELPVTDHRNFTHAQEVYFTDPGIFDMFTLVALANQLKGSLDQPNTVILSRKAANRYFGTLDVVGSELILDFNGADVTLQVTGIFEDMPRSHMPMEVLASFETLRPLMDEDHLTTWLRNYLCTFILLDEQSDIAALDQKSAAFVQKYLAEVFKPYLGNNRITDVFQLQYRPLPDIYLKSDLSYDIGETGSYRQVVTFSIVALLILLTACINFINLSTARAGKRSLEVGIRKVSGAARRQLFCQFLAESVALSLVALMVSLALVELFMPLFNHFSGKELSWMNILNLQTLGMLLGITLTAGILAGLYPALVLSSFKPILVLKGFFRSGKDRLRVSLVVLQFAISVALIICTLVIRQQYMYFADKDLGYDRENLLVLRVEGDEQIRRMDAFRNELMANPRVLNVSASSSVPSSESIGDAACFREGDSSREMRFVFNMGADEHYLDTHDIQLIAGRNFSRERGTDENAVILNQQAVKELGFASAQAAVNGRIGVVNQQGETVYRPILGVIRDYHFRSLHHKIDALSIGYFPGAVNYVTVRLAPGDPVSVMAFVEATWGRMFPGTAYNASFADDRLNRFYVKERKVQDLLFSFTLLGIFVACLGLYGLSAFAAEQRIKEVGIRKVMGASVSNIVLVFLKDFAWWVLTAVAIGWPVAWYFMNRWLEGFAYRIQLSPLVFLLGGSVALVIAIGTVGFQAARSAVRNPVESLKYE